MKTEYKAKLSVLFLVPLETLTDSKAVKEGYKEIARQIMEFAASIEKDPNILITHSVVSEDIKDMKPVVDNLADSKLASLQAMKQPKTSKIPKPVNKKEDDEFAEKPHIVIHDDWKPTTTPNKPVVKAEVKSENPINETLLAIDAAISPKANVTNLPDDTILNSLFENIKKTEKSQVILKYLVDNRDTDITTSALVAGTKLDNNGVGSWLQTTGKLIKAISSPKRGYWRFDSSKVNA